VRDKFGKPMLTATDSSNPWWTLLEEAVRKANGKLGKPEIFPAATDARYYRLHGLPAIGFSPIANTPILLHDHNEVTVLFNVLVCNEYTLFTACLHGP
jgi:aminoacylase